MFTDGWSVFDFVIVLTSWSLETMQVFRALRIFRAFRLVTRMKPLRDLVLAIAAVMPRMSAIAMLLLLIFYIIAVLFTELFGSLVLTGDYFNRLDNSLFTCMQMVRWQILSSEIVVDTGSAFDILKPLLPLLGHNDDEDDARVGRTNTRVHGHPSRPSSP